MPQDQIHKTFDLHQPLYNNIYLVAGASARKATQASTARASTTPAGPILVKMAVYVAKSTATTTNVLVLKVRKHNPTYYLSWHTSVLELPSLLRCVRVCVPDRAPALGVSPARITGPSTGICNPDVYYLLEKFYGEVGDADKLM